MPDTFVLEPWREIQGILDEHDRGHLTEYLATLSPGEIARAITYLDDEYRSQLLRLLEPETAADLIAELSDMQGVELLEELSAHEAAAIIEELESDHRADLLSELDRSDAEAILREMDPEEAEDARRLLDFAPDTAGGIMVTEFVSYPQDRTVEDVIDDLRRNADLYSDYGVQYAYVISSSGTLVGVVRLRDLILSRRNAPITTVMIANPVCVQVDATLDELEQLFDRYSFVGVPVINDEGRLVGVVRRSDAEEAFGEESERALMRFGGIVSGEELRSTGLFERAFMRLAWLSLNLVLSLIASSVILHFQQTIDRVIALAFFLPVIGNLSGCSGNQAVAVSIRELALGLIEPRDFLRVMGREARIGLINGPLMGLLIGTATLLLFRDPWLAFVVGAALAVNNVLAVIFGGSIPLVLRKLNVDPALAAPPILTTLLDFLGFSIVLTMATWILARHPL
jgi:magnesium transporter